MKWLLVITAAILVTITRRRLDKKIEASIRRANNLKRWEQE